MNIFIRADGGNLIGLGHVMRMIVLGKELATLNKVFFICRSSNLNKEKFGSGIDMIKKNKFSVIEISEENVIEDIINSQKKYKAELIITDSYEVDEEYFNALRSYFKYTGYVDDINKLDMNVDFLINQNFKAEYMDYSKNVKFNTKLFLGSKYCMLREEFRTQYFKVNKNSENVEDVLLTLGGMDKDYNTLKILKQIEGCKINIHVVVGVAFDKMINDELINISSVASNIFLHTNPNMSELMNKCDIAISACGSTLYELCAMKVPTIGIVIADNQERLGKQMCEEGAILGGKWVWEHKQGELKDLLNKLITNKEVRENIIKRQSNLINKNGVHLLKEEIEKLIRREV